MRGFDACAAKLRRMAASPPAPRAPDAADGSAQAAAAGLLYVSDADPGFARRRAGRGFSYRDADGATVRDRPVIERIRATVRNELVGEVAAALRNTPAVCRRAYIDPRVFAGWEDGSLARAAAKARGPRQWEQAAARFLRRAGRG